MLFLAQVNQSATSPQLELGIIAAQQANQSWVLVPMTTLALPPTPAITHLSAGHFVVLELDDQQTIQKITLANDLMLSLLQRYLEHDVTPDFVEAEKDRIEQWRQTLTSQSQDLTRRNLEVETRREQLQELETRLKRQQADLEQQRQALNPQDNLRQES